MDSTRALTALTCVTGHELGATVAQLADKVSKLEAELNLMKTALCYPIDEPFPEEDASLLWTCSTHPPCFEYLDEEKTIKNSNFPKNWEKCKAEVVWNITLEEIDEAFLDWHQENYPHLKTF